MKTIILLFGITGDLSRRKLLPAIEEVCQEIPKPYQLIGVSRRQVAVDSIIPTESRLHNHVSIVTMDLADQSAYSNLWQQYILNQPEDVRVIVYLAVPPLGLERILTNLSASGFRDPRVQLLIEKPFGSDVRSSEDLFQLVRSLFDADQLYFVDHYLGKRAARQIVEFRQKAPILSKIWNRKSIQSIEIGALESLDIEGRAAFYEQTGALKDIIQGHLLQLLAMTIGDTYGGVTGISQIRLEALRGILPARPEDSVRAQYEGYRDQVGSPNSQIETFASLVFYSDKPAWQGVPMRLVTGKNLAEKRTYVRINLLETPDHSSGHVDFSIQPELGVVAYFERDGELEQAIKAVVDTDGAINQSEWNGYQAIISDAIQHERDYFVTEAEIIASWQAVDDILINWSRNNPELKSYKPKSSLDDIIGSTTDVEL